ncbi:hypothetical protein FR932_08750 [Moritella marina ATCC 15381]|uniref:Uncharacterized protein n=1 Tax=Moritella marina ATCC 15381 TaxID=1202962 RepID=A0A5J6WN74_MORMI|nr:hypothetical protein [Moritella marina]QFI37932.1 hypothetical protein FR932_08750 [Moritella marina ATCC 15381]
MLINVHSIDENISIGHTPNVEEVKLLENQTLCLAATALIEGLEHLGKFETQIDKLKSIQNFTGNGEYA